MTATLLQARWIVPVTASPIENGWVRIENGLIVDVGARSPRPGGGTPPLHDLGDAAIFPGLINCHAHIEFASGDHPRHSFAAWVKSVQTAQARQGDTETGRQGEIWFENLSRLIATGTTTVVNHANFLPPFIKGCHREESASGGRRGDLPDSSDSSRLLRRSAPRNDNKFSFPHIHHILEIVGSSSERAAKSYHESCRMRLELLNGGANANVSPTSLYAVSPTVWDQFLANRDRSNLLSIHIKESEEEKTLFQDKRGLLAKLVKAKGGEFWLQDPIAWLKEKQLLGSQTLLIHGNYLTDSDLAILQGTGASVIHCPGSHHFFGHQRFPLEAIRDTGINMALGTDSLASNEDLSMLCELRLLKANYPELSTQEIVKMATLNGAQAISADSNRGSLEVGKWADVIAVPCGDEDPYEALLKAEKVEMSMIRGETAYHKFQASNPK